MGEVPVHRGTADTQHLRYVGGRRDAFLPQAARLGGVGIVDLVHLANNDRG